MSLGKCSVWFILTLAVACSHKPSAKVEKPTETVAEQAKEDTVEVSQTDTAAVPPGEVARLPDVSAVTMGRGRISPHDYIVKKHARRYGFDWRLISAQIFAESGFREQSVSRVGAVGLMQIMPGTAKYLGAHPDLLLRPEDNIALGCLYDRKLYEIWEEERGDDRLAFMFASFNAGHRKVIKAQALATIKNTWEGIKRHVPGETRHYVYKIFKRFEEYKMKVL